MDFEIIDFKNYESKKKDIEIDLKMNNIKSFLSRKVKIYNKLSISNNKFRNKIRRKVNENIKSKSRRFNIKRLILEKDEEEEDNEYERVDYCNLTKKITLEEPSIRTISGYNFLQEKNILIYTPDFLKDLKSSYNTYSAEKQFLMDLHRCHLFINYSRVNDSEQAKDYLEWKYNKEMKDNIILSCTQAIMGMPFQILQKLFSSLNLYISECEEKKSSNLQIFLNAYEDKINIFVKKNLRAFYIDKNLDDVSKYYINTIIDYNLYTNEKKQENDNYVLIKFDIKQSDIINENKFNKLKID